MTGPRKVVILQSAKSDYRRIKNNVTQKFGAETWLEINHEWKGKLNKLAVNPELGSNISELDGTGWTVFKRYQYKNAYAVYQTSDALLTVYMFIPSMRDFRRHLMDRLLAACQARSHT
jgi:plasmid stabilization system protein ParE